MSLNSSEEVIPKTEIPGWLYNPLIQAHQGINKAVRCHSLPPLMAAVGVKPALQKRSASVRDVTTAVVDGVFVLMDSDNCGGGVGGGGVVCVEVRGVGAELVEERLNTHLPSPEMLIKEERCQVPASQLPLLKHVHGRAQARVLY